MTYGPEFAYSNLSERGPRPFVTAAGWVLPGVARVQRQVAPFAARWQRANAEALAGRDPIWVALGDSLTQGIGAPSPELGWVGQLRDRLAAGGRRYGVVNLAVSGAKTVDVLDRQLPVLAALPVRPHLVSLMIGSNDLMRPANRRALVARFEQVLQRLPTGALVTTLPNPSRVAGEVNAAVTRLAGERGLVVAELRDPRLASWRGRLAADHFHPNQLGYAGLAEVIGDVLGRASGLF